MPRFRITAWPGGRVAVPSVAIGDVSIEGDYFAFAEESQRIEVPDELYLRELLELDLSDREALLHFSRSYGRLAEPQWKLLPTAAFDFEERREIDQRKRSDNGPPSLDSPPDAGFGYLAHADEIALYARHLRACVRVWIAFTNDDPLTVIQEAWVTERLHNPYAADVGGPLTSHLIRVCETLNSGLMPFHVRLEYEDDQVPDYTSFAPRPGLYSALCLQLQNHIAEDAVVRRCSNEPCGRFFVRQDGRAEFGQNRTEGVMYCSKNCARAQATRNWRRRNRTQTRGS